MLGRESSRLGIGRGSIPPRSGRMRQVRAAGAVVFRPGPDSEPRYLLIRNAKGHWDFPKGRLEPGESWAAARHREIAEETGLRGLRFLRGWARRLAWTVRDSAGVAYRKTVEFRLASAPRGARVRLSPEHVAARWVTAARGRRMLRYSNARDLLAAADRACRRGSAGPHGGRRRGSGR